MADIDPAIITHSLAARKVIERRAPVRALYLFGSQADGRSHEWSDIDLAAFVEGAETWGPMTRAEAATDVMLEVSADVETHFFPASQLMDPPAASFAEFVLRHGVPVWQDPATQLPAAV